jgi:hypothetical protein
MQPFIRWHRIFRQLGYQICVEEGGDFTFEDEGVRFRCMIDPDDLYLHLILPNVWRSSDHSPGVRAKAATIANEVNSQVKCAKVLLHDNGAYVSVEAYLTTQAIAAKVIPALLQNAKLAGFLFDKSFFESEQENSEQLVLIR